MLCTLSAHNLILHFLLFFCLPMTVCCHSHGAAVLRPHHREILPPDAFSALSSLLYLPLDPVSYTHLKRIPAVIRTEFQNIIKYPGESSKSSTYARRVGYMGKRRNAAYPPPFARTGARYPASSCFPIREPAARNNTGYAASSAKNPRITKITFFIPPSTLSPPSSLQKQDKYQNSQKRKHCPGCHLIKRKLPEPVVKHMLQQIHLSLIHI